MVLILLGIGARVAHAEGERFRFVYERAPGAEACPDEQQMRDELERRLGREPFGSDARTTLLCRVGRRAGGLRAVISVVDAGGPGPERVLDSPHRDCADLAQAMELTLALAIDPSAVDGASAPVPAEARPPARQAQAEVVRPVTPVSSVVAQEAQVALPRARLSAVFGAAVAVDVGLGPGPGLGVAASAGVRGDVWSLELELGATLSTGVDALGGTVRAQLGALSIVPCWWAGRLALCGVARAGVLRGSGEGFAGARSDTAFSAGAGARVSWPVAGGGGVAVRVLAEVTTSIAGGRLVADDRELWRNPPLAAAFGLAVAFE